MFQTFTDAALKQSVFNLDLIY